MGSRQERYNTYIKISILTKKCHTYRKNDNPCMRVSMGLIVSRKTAKKISRKRKNEKF